MNLVVIEVHETRNLLQCHAMRYLLQLYHTHPVAKLGNVSGKRAESANINED
jgi:hypothetical protein